MSEGAMRLTGGDPVAMAVLGELVEAKLECMGAKEARAYLRALASRAARPDGNVVDLQDRADARSLSAARDWLREQLPGWLSRHG